jgi:hydroxymethylpyrimidine pyrophosphatase-like HAD family hydrolase
VRYLVLACDYDGTLAHDGVVDQEMIEALERLTASGRKLVLVTGRDLDDLLRVFPRIGLFSRVVAENGGLLYTPERREARALADPPPPAFVHELERRKVRPLSVGRVVVATWEPNQNVVLELIRELGLELQVSFNKGAVMVLPSGVNKRSGLAAALAELGISFHNVVSVGDAENDHEFLRASEVAVAVANALPALKEQADLVTSGARGAGVRELIDQLLEDDLSSLHPTLLRHHVPVGVTDSGSDVRLNPYGSVVLLAGASGAGKSTAATGIIDHLAERGYQVCVVDPEGDYEGLEGAVATGSADQPPNVDHVLQVLARPADHAVVTLLGMPIEDRPRFFLSLLARLHEFHVGMGRPHWLVVDEAHHMLDESFWPPSTELPHEVGSLLLITVHPERIHKSLLRRVDIMIAVGAQGKSTIEAFARAINAEPPKLPPEPEQPNQAIFWDRCNKAAALRVRVAGARSARRRHLRKYARGALGPDKSFYFRGPEGRLKLRCHNLALFNQIAEGVDDDTWQHHLQQHDYSSWIRDAIKDDDLAHEVHEIEQRELSPEASRLEIRHAIERRYTLEA